MIELTNAIRKLTASLEQAKHRREAGLFKAEGTKCVLDTLGHFRPRHLMATAAWAAEHPDTCLRHEGVLTQCAPRDMERMSSLSTPPPVIAVYEIPDEQRLDADADNSLILALDEVQDPGNLGAIMRVCDWMGVDVVLASRDTADVYQPKVVQATMGAISRVRVVYGDLPQMIGQLKPPHVMGTFLDGDDIYRADLPRSGVIVMGNEGRGVSPEVAALVTRRLTIPSYPPGRPTSESLNVATATAITLAMFRKSSF